MQPAAYQQTVKNSFTLGGLGLHSGEYGMRPSQSKARQGYIDILNSKTNTKLAWLAAYLRVRPALADEGRYFVRVPEGIEPQAFKNSTSACLSQRYACPGYVFLQAQTAPFS